MIGRDRWLEDVGWGIGGGREPATYASDRRGLMNRKRGFLRLDLDGAGRDHSGGHNAGDSLGADRPADCANSAGGAAAADGGAD